MRRSSMLEKFNGATVELVRSVISAKEADAPTIVVDTASITVQTQPRLLCGVGKQKAKVIRFRTRDVR